MSRNRKEYIDQLLNDLELLKARLLSVKESDTLPFSFFSASFDRIEKISRSLHELELMQIGEMKIQMEQLVKFLSEQPKHLEPLKSEPDRILDQEQPTVAEGNPTLDSESIPEKTEYVVPELERCPPKQEIPSPELNIPSQKQEYPPAKQEDPSPEPSKNIEELEKKPLREGIDLPEYKDPRISVATQSPVGAIRTNSVICGPEKPLNRSLNDTIQVSSTLLDLKKGISLNDRFLFQRELFNNNRSEMNRVMELLSTLGSFEEAENYLRSEHEWDFDHRTVKEFLLIIKKGFE